MTTDIKLSKTQPSKIIQIGGLSSALLGKWAGPLIKVCVLLAKKFLAPFATMESASAIDGAIQRKLTGTIEISRTGVLRAGKGIAWIILNENMDDTIRSIRSL